VRLNQTRIDFVAKFEELIESYNQGSRNIDELFRRLVALSKSLTDEQQRYVHQNLTEEELTVFDILTRPAPDFVCRRAKRDQKSCPPIPGTSEDRFNP
jgi:type I restriction enzyme R subunit